MLDYRKQQDWANGFGQQQSPIGFLSATAQQETVSLPLFQWQDTLTVTTVIDRETNFETTGTGQALLWQQPAQFQQLHFHAPAEHQIDGHQAAMEWHFVFQDQLGQLSVVARFAELGAANPLFEQLLTNFKSRQTATLPQPIAVNSWLPQAGIVYRYLGSLTTPPLTEGVHWYLVATPLTVSVAQLQKYREFFPQDNNRQLQDLQQRHLFKTVL